MITQYKSKHDSDIYTIWQIDKKEGVPEPALQLDDYSVSRIVDIYQGNTRININIDTLPELIKVLRAYQKKYKGSEK